MNASSTYASARAVLIAAGVTFAVAALVPGCPGRAQERRTERPHSASAEREAARAPMRGRRSDFEAVGRMIVSATNEFRLKHGRAEVNVDPRLAQAARHFADYMAKTGKYGHTADGERPEERVEQRGYAFCIVAENIAYAYRSTGYSRQGLAEELVQGWIHSPPHRKNLLDAAVTDLGVAVARSAKTGYYYAVQDFARPRSAIVRFTVTNFSSRALTYEVSGRRYSLAPRTEQTHEECRPPQLEFLPPRRGSLSGRKSFRPEPKDRFVVTDSDGRLTVERRRSPAGTAATK